MILFFGECMELPAIVVTLIRFENRSSFFIIENQSNIPNQFNHVRQQLMRYKSTHKALFIQGGSLPTSSSTALQNIINEFQQFIKHDDHFNRK
jgi:hypothetical protein